MKKRYWMIPLLLLWLIYPRMTHKKRIRPIRGMPVAHRGLHDQEKPENSLAAFQAAVEKGYLIELDVQRLKDGTLVVFHDDDYQRLCGSDQRHCDLQMEEVQEFRLLESDHGIPTLQEVLAVVDGQVGLIIELKGKDWRISRDVARVLDHYGGYYVIESFNPLLLLWFRIFRPKVVRGQLSFRADNFFMRHLLLHAISRPDFTAYQYEGRKNLSLWILRNIFRQPQMCYTVKDPISYEAMKKRFDNVIFEGFEPNKNS